MNASTAVPPAEALRALPGPVAGWFADRFGEPTAAQRLAWPALAAGANLLLSSPTGSGKTLAAFAPVLGHLLAGERPGRCLYVAPLKALVNDIRKGLRAAVRQLRARLAEAPQVRIGVRTGDTPVRARRRLLQCPPDILLTTPETLAVLLAQPAADGLLAGLRWLVVDEVHAVAATKRGADLALGLERLAELSPGLVQRVGLSATCAPLAEAARYLAGAGRSCVAAQVPDRAPLDLRIELLDQGPGFWARLVERVGAEIESNATTLVFANARGLAERLCWALSRRLPERAGQIAVHHSSLDAGRRRTAERRLKQGRLRAVVTSTSLELGIDIGAVETVVLVHPPGGAVRLLQRLGRAGHAPGRPRRGLLLAATAAELLEAAVTAAAGRSAQWERLSVPEHPLDVLCQHLVGMAARRAWHPDEALALVRRAYPYRDLPAEDFSACLDYLSGRRGDGGPWLPARLRWVGDEFTIADRRTARLLIRNLGTVLAEESRPVRLSTESKVQSPGSKVDLGLWTSDLGLPVGEVEVAFADRLRPGDRFLLDGRCLQVARADGGEVLVKEVSGRPLVPRWGRDGLPLSVELAERLYALRVRAAEALREGPRVLATLLRHDYGLDAPAAAALTAYFERQECASEIPDSRTCLVEVVAAAFTTDCYLHTSLNRAGNDALARVAVRRLARDVGRSASSVVADLGFMLSVGGAADIPVAAWRALLAADRFDEDLDAALADGPSLRERFRRVAFTGLMLLRHPLGGRRRVGGPDWAERMLYDRVFAAEPDFALLRQARREARAACDALAARAFLVQLPHGTVRVRHLPRVSPFAESWTQPAAGPVQPVLTPTEALEQLHASLTRTPA